MPVRPAAAPSVAPLAVGDNIAARRIGTARITLVNSRVGNVSSAARQRAFREEMTELMREHSRSIDNTALGLSEYLEVVATRL